MHVGPIQPPGGRAFAVLAAVCLAAFLSSAVSAEFLNFDDVRLFGPTSELKAAGFAGIFDPTHTIVDAYLPVSHLSLWLDRAVFGDRPLGPHLHSLLLHVLVAFAIARLAFRLGLSRAAATAAAAVFALHPALCESVLWVSGRKDLLSGLFAVLALSVVARHGRGELATRPATVRAGVFTLLAVYAKGTAIVIPLLAAVVALLVAPRDRRARFVPTAVTAAVAGLAAVHHALIAAGAGTLAPAAGLTERLVQVPGAFLHYLATSVWPTGLDVLYPEVATLEAFRAAFVPGLIALLAYGAAVAVLWRPAPRVAGGLALFGLALLPFNTAFPASSIAAADRYLYLAIPGLAIALAAVPRWGVVLAATAAVPLLFGSHARAADFERSEALWKASLARDPDNAAAMINLAPVLLDPNPLSTPFIGRVTFAVDRLVEVEELLERALDVARYPQHRVRAASTLTELARATSRVQRAAHFADRAAAAADALDPRDRSTRPLRVQLHLDAARLARLDGDLDEATRHYESAREVAPQHPFVLCFEASLLLVGAADEHGRVALDDPRVARATALLDAAEAADADLYELHWTRGEWARATGRLLQAEKSFRDAIGVDPRRPEAWLARADLFLSREGMAATAAEVAREGLRHVDDPGLHFRLALALSADGEIQDARRHYEAYLALRPGDSQARAGLASVLAAIGMQQLYQTDPEALDRLAGRIQELDPTNPKARMMQAVAARSRHELVEALVLLEGLREALPGDPEVSQLYAETLRDRGWQLKLKEGRPDAAFDHFVEFLAVAPASVPTEAVENAVGQEWRRQLDAGRAALVAADAGVAEQCFRRCRVLRPDDARTVIDYFLGLAIYQGAADDDAARLEEALACFERADRGRAEEGGDRGLAVLYQVQVLLRLDRPADARARAEEFLAEPGGAADDVVERIRDAIGS